MTTAMLLPMAVPVSVERDGWDWTLYAASLFAAITAIVLFLPWALQRRRGPEVRIEWGLSLEGNPAKLDHWPADHVPHVTPSRAVSVGVAVHNVGDGASDAALTNFAVPDCFDLRSYANLDAEPAYSGNPSAGLPPEHRVAYFAPRLEPWTPGNSFLYAYRLTYPTGHHPDQPLRARLLFEVADSRFNRSGRRWLPSLFRRSNSATRRLAGCGRRDRGGHDSNGFTLSLTVASPVHQAAVGTSGTSSCSRHSKPWLHQLWADTACWTAPDGDSHAWSTGCRLRTSSGLTGFCHRGADLSGTPIQDLLARRGFTRRFVATGVLLNLLRTGHSA